MFNKKNCKKCNEKINDKYRFCPTCGSKLNNNYEKKWGLLGRNNSFEEDNFISPFQGINEGFLNKMLGNAMKMLEKEMNKLENSQKTNFKLMINGKEIKLNENYNKNTPKIQTKIKREFNQKQLKEFLNLPKKEPKTNLKRFGDKILYEIEMPGVKSFEDIIINKLENSMEIKAIGKENAYLKIIPVNMPIINQNLIKGKLILELKEK